MNLDHLKHFCTVYDCKSILRASSTLFITQQGLSKSIKSLEKEFDTSLFIRTHDGVIPTSFADSIINNVRTILEEEATINHKLEELLKKSDDIITASCSNMLLQVLPIGTQVKVESAAPNSTFVYFERSEREALNDVLNEKSNFAFISNPPDESNFNVTRILEYPLMAMVSTANPLSRKRVLHLSDLVDSYIVPFTNQWNFHYSLIEFLQNKGFDIKVQFEAEDAIHMFTIVNNRLGVGILPSLYANYIPANNNVKYIPFDEDIPWAISVITRKGRRQSDAIDRIIVAFQEQAKIVKQQNNFLQKR